MLLESALDISLPESFRAAASFFDGSGIESMNLHALARDPSSNVLAETLRLRKSIELPHNYIVLGEPPESFLVLDCNDGAVIWCDATDAPRLGKEMLVRPADTWATFGDFLNAQLAEEEAGAR